MDITVNSDVLEAGCLAYLDRVALYVATGPQRQAHAAQMAADGTGAIVHAIRAAIAAWEARTVPVNASGGQVAEPVIRAAQQAYARERGQGVPSERAMRIAVIDAVLLDRAWPWGPREPL